MKRLIIALALVLGAVGLVAVLYTQSPLLKTMWTAQRWGVSIQGIRQSAGGYMLDFRYRVVYAKRAAALMDRRVKPYLIDQESGTKLMVPSSPKVGPMRQTVKYGEPPEDRTFFVLFANPGRMISVGDTVTVVIGDFRAENLVVH